MPWQLPSKFFPLHHSNFPFDTTYWYKCLCLRTQSKQCVFKTQSACQGYGKACRGMYGWMHSFYRNGKHVGFLAGLRGSQRSFPNSYFLPRLAESVLEPILRQQRLPPRHSANFTPNIPHSPQPLSTRIFISRSYRVVSQSLQSTRNLQWWGERNFGCSEVQISTYLQSTPQILENLFI
jgi:hypothetical protein